MKETWAKLKIDQRLASFGFSDGNSLLNYSLNILNGLRRFRYLSSSLRSSSLHVRYRITEFDTYHKPVRYLYLVKKLKACVGEVMVPFTRHNLVFKTLCRIITQRHATINSHHITTSCCFACKCSFLFLKWLIPLDVVAWNTLVYSSTHCFGNIASETFSNNLGEPSRF